MNRFINNSTVCENKIITCGEKKKKLCFHCNNFEFYKIHIDNDNLLLLLLRTGTHSDLF